MNKIILHIEYLLLRHDCVVVPGLGAFLNVRKNSYYDKENGLWMPPTEEIRFNRAVSHDDALLASSYARREKIDYATASGILRHHVKEIHDILQSEGEFMIGRIGMLVQDQDSISFSPSSSPASGAADEGLFPVRYEERTLSETIQPDSDEKGALRVFDTRKNYYLAINKRFARSVASVVLVLIVAMAAIIPFGKNFNEDQASIIPVKVISEAIETTYDKPSHKALHNVTDSIVATEDSGHNYKSDKSAEWQIIVGTFRTQQEAERYIAANGGKGYDLTVLPSSRLKRISAIGAEKKETLIEIMNSAEFQNKYPQAWIYRSEKK